jgi:anti-sigma factor RsiW
LDGELAGNEMLQIRSHLNSCVACCAEADAVRHVKWVVNNLPEHEPSEEFRERLSRNVFASAPAAQSPFQFSMALVSTAAFTAALLSAFAWVHQSHPQAALTPTQQTTAVRESSFELDRDQAYAAGSDPLTGGSVMLTSAHGTR